MLLLLVSGPLWTAVGLCVTPFQRTQPPAQSWENPHLSTRSVRLGRLGLPGSYQQGWPLLSWIYSFLGEIPGKGGNPFPKSSIGGQ